MDRDARRVADLLAEDPSLAADVMRWVESSRAVGRDGVFAAYRAPAVPVEARPELVARRRAGAGGNRLFHADNLGVLRSLADEGVSARCVYIDPPYGTRQQFARKVTEHAAYCDEASGATYLAELRARLVLLRELLAEDGSIFVHLDASMVAQVKTLMDELFGPANFRAWITRRKCSSKNFTRRTFGDVSDYVLFYSRGPSYVFNRPCEPRSAEQEAIDFPKVDPASGRRFALVPVHAPGRRKGATGAPWRGMLPPEGKHWQWTPEKLDAANAKGDIRWSRNGTPRRKIWADESPGTPVHDIWHDFRDPFNQSFAITGYPTEKNLALLERIVGAGSNPGDLVLDAYAGSGTALVAADHLGRRWIGIDRGELAVALAQRRLVEQGAGFELWAPEPTAGSASGEVEFAFLESAGVVQDVLAPGQVPGRIASLRPGKRVVTFGHGGREAVYEAGSSRLTA